MATLFILEIQRNVQPTYINWFLSFFSGVLAHFSCHESTDDMRGYELISADMS
jgi:hypothetical protein